MFRHDLLLILLVYLNIACKAKESIIKFEGPLNYKNYNSTKYKFDSSNNLDAGKKVKGSDLAKLQKKKSKKKKNLLKNKQLKSSTYKYRKHNTIKKKNTKTRKDLNTKKKINYSENKKKKMKNDYYWANASVVAFICYFIGLPMSLVIDFFGMGLILTFCGLSILLAKNIRDARHHRRIYTKINSKKK